AGEGNADDRRDPASVQRVSLDDHDWTPESWRGASPLWDVGPPDVALGDRHQSLRFRARRDAARTNWSFGSPISSRARSIAAATRSGAGRARYAARARLYASLRERSVRRASCSASSNTSSGTETATFIPGV